MDGYLRGLGLAEELVRNLGIRDPRALRAAAAIAEERGEGTPLELGVVAGYRLIAEDILDDVEPWQSVHRVLAEAAREEDRELDRRHLSTRISRDPANAACRVPRSGR